MPHGARFSQIISIQNPATSQSGSLWRNPCVGGTLAGNYRVGPDYNVDYATQEPHSGEQGQAPHPYDTHHHRGSLQHSGPPALHDAPSHPSHHGLPQHYATPHHPHPILTDPTHLAGHPSARHMGHPGPSHFGAGPSPHTVVAPLYPSLTTTHGHTAGVKRSRPDDLDLSVPGMPQLEHSDLESMQQTPLGAAYAQASAPPTHHHHRLPDTGPPNKLMRREGDNSGGRGGGAPSMVGQAGMPAPAPQPRGPKLKFTPEDDQLLIDLKENKNLTWKQIADFFPGRSSGTLQVRYCTKLKAKTTQWTDETDQKLKTALQDYENEKWRIIANKVGTGFTPAACRERAAQLSGENL
ncbi:transcriptional activator Myb [Corynascus novoguineensis]|uniref:Transcriptional activator Myb n=1 Tax=Corynascus novoguineensis TaxID=1126955 RepID=A0AAN7HMJ8_9PEZI|nr:transcriptional activator Myb [Corynascus novoguineensis]